MGRKTPPCPKYPAWTVARYNSFVRSALRQCWNRWPPKFDCLKAAKRTVTGQRHRYEYQCAMCKGWFKQKEVQVDHIEEAGSSEDLNTFVDRLLCSIDNLRVLCIPCHKGVTKEARKK